MLSAVLPVRGDPKLPRKPKSPRVVELLRKAVEWQALLESGKVGTQAEIARRERVAKYIAVPISTIRYWTIKGFIPHIKLPAAVRFQPEIIIEWTRAMAKGTGVPRNPKDIASDILSANRAGPPRVGKTSK